MAEILCGDDPIGKKKSKIMAIKKVCGEKKFALTCTVLSEVSY